jgi:hypothetical protein
MANLTPWQFLIWLAAVLMITVPLIAIMFGMIFNKYYKAKENFIYRTVSNFAKAFEATAKNITEELSKKGISNGKSKSNKANDSNSNS